MDYYIGLEYSCGEQIEQKHVITKLQLFSYTFALDQARYHWHEHPCKCRAHSISLFKVLSCCWMVVTLFHLRLVC